MRQFINIIENAGRTITLWHGGRDLEFNYQEILAHRTGRWEHGPGLYLTTHYDRAATYAKGGGKTYLITVREGTNIDDCEISIDAANEFVDRYVSTRHRRNIKNDLLDNMKRVGVLRPEVLVNLCLNHDAIRPAQTKALRELLIQAGVDYIVVSRFGGRDEKLLVVVNPTVIVSVKPASAQDVKDRVLPFVFQ